MPEFDVLHADAFEALSDLPDDYADCAVIDYPWEFTIQNGTGRFEYRRKPGKGDGEGDRDLERDDAMFQMAEDEQFSVLIEELARVITDGSWVVCMADDRFQDVIRATLKESDEFILRRNWAWSPGGMGMGAYGRVSHYPIPVANTRRDEQIRARSGNVLPDRERTRH